MLTLEGLSRVTRHVIRRFVATQPKVDSEVYDYSRERAGIVFIERASQYWIGKPFSDAAEARKRLESLMSLVCAVMTREPDTQLVDMRPVLADIERILPQAPHRHRLAMLSIHILFNFVVSAEHRSPGFDTFFAKHGEEAGALGVESLAVAALLNGTDDWEVVAHAAMLDRYFLERNRPSGLHAPRLIEAAMCLALAEKYRLAGDETNARGYVAMAIEAHPGRAELHALEQSFSMERALEWREILLPRPDKATEASEGDAPARAEGPVHQPQPAQAPEVASGDTSETGDASSKDE